MGPWAQGQLMPTTACTLLLATRTKCYAKNKNEV